MQFDSPWSLWLLSVIPPLLWLGVRRNRPGTIRFSSITEAVQAGRSLRQRLSVVPRCARLLALVLLILCLARPQKGSEQVQEIKKGIAIEMVIDRSPSMAAAMEFQGQQLNRLQVVKRVFEEFVTGNGRELKGRPNDLVGIVSFAGLAETVCPLTLAHEAFPGFLETVQFNEGGTAIGDAIALAAARLRTAEETLARQSQRSRESFSLQSKVMILLTDGRNNAGRRHPLQAAELAAKWGIKIYAVGIGGRNPETLGPNPFGGFPSRLLIESVDEASLKAIAEKTGGQFRMAEDADALKSICMEIDRLERSEIQVSRSRTFKELFPPLALAAFLLVSAETVLNCTVLRRIP